MQTGAMDAGMTSSTSLISFRLEEVSKALTTGRKYAYWFMFEPLMMSKQIFDKLPANQKAAIMSVGADMEKFALESAKADDIEVSNVYLKAGAKVYDLDEPTVKKWQAIARETAWKDYAAKPTCRPSCWRPRSRRCEPRPRGAGPPCGPGAAAVGTLARMLAGINRLVLFLSMIALVLAAACSRTACSPRYFFHAATDWQDELAVFLLVGATSCAAPTCSRIAGMSESRRSQAFCRARRIGGG
jgi:hypothetical protein